MYTVAVVWLRFQFFRSRCLVISVEVSDNPMLDVFGNILSAGLRFG